jgi:hypothetical protein
MPHFLEGMTVRDVRIEKFGSFSRTIFWVEGWQTNLQSRGRCKFINSQIRVGERETELVVESIVPTGILEMAA